MISELWNAFKWAVRTAWPLMTVRMHNDMCEQYEACIDQQADQIEELLGIISRYESMELEDVVTVGNVLHSDWVPGKAVTIFLDEADTLFDKPETHHAPMTDEEHGIARMETDGCVDPNLYGRE